MDDRPLTHSSDPSAPADPSDPYPRYAERRRRSPVYWSERSRAWVLSRYADVGAALRDPALSSERILPWLAELPVELHGPMAAFEESLGRWLLWRRGCG